MPHDEKQIISCPSCGQKNRVTQHNANGHSNCANCGQVIKQHKKYIPLSTLKKPIVSLLIIMALLGSIQVFAKSLFGVSIYHQLTYFLMSDDEKHRVHIAEEIIQKLKDKEFGAIEALIQEIDTSRARRGDQYLRSKQLVDDIHDKNGVSPLEVAHQIGDEALKQFTEYLPHMRRANVPVEVFTSLQRIKTEQLAEIELEREQNKRETENLLASWNSCEKSDWNLCFQIFWKLSWLEKMRVIREVEKIKDGCRAGEQGFCIVYARALSGIYMSGHNALDYVEIGPFITFRETPNPERDQLYQYLLSEKVREHIPLDLAAARNLFRASCNLNYKEACGLYGVMMFYGYGGVMNVHKSIDYLIEGCVLKWPFSCAALRHAQKLLKISKYKIEQPNYFYKKIEPEQFDNGATEVFNALNMRNRNSVGNTEGKIINHQNLYATACVKGNFTGCINYLKTEPVESLSVTSAINQVGDICSSDYSHCIYLQDYFENEDYHAYAGKHTKNEWALIHRLYPELCRQKQPRACLKLSSRYRERFIMDKTNYREAKLYSDLACSQGEYAACFHKSNILYTQSDRTNSLAYVREAIEPLRIACNAEYRNACDALSDTEQYIIEKEKIIAENEALKYEAEQKRLAEAEKRKKDRAERRERARIAAAQEDFINDGGTPWERLQGVMQQSKDLYRQQLAKTDPKVRAELDAERARKLARAEAFERRMNKPSKSFEESIAERVNKRSRANDNVNDNKAYTKQRRFWHRVVCHAIDNRANPPVRVHFYSGVYYEENDIYDYPGSESTNSDSWFQATEYLKNHHEINYRNKIHESDVSITACFHSNYENQEDASYDENNELKEYDIFSYKKNIVVVRGEQRYVRPQNNNQVNTEDRHATQPAKYVLSDMKCVDSTGTDPNEKLARENITTVAENTLRDFCTSRYGAGYLGVKFQDLVIEKLQYGRVNAKGMVYTVCEVDKYDKGYDSLTWCGPGDKELGCATETPSNQTPVGACY